MEDRSGDDWSRVSLTRLRDTIGSAKSVNEAVDILEDNSYTPEQI
jgi:hypothetical protein